METFEEILNKHKGIIFRIVNYYCKDADDKKDLEQEILIQIWLSYKKYNQEFAWSTFIYRIALNVSIGFYKKQKRQKDKFSSVNLFIETYVQDETPLVIDEDLRMLNEFIFQLNDINPVEFVPTAGSWIQNVVVSQPNITNENEVHVKIYF